VHVQFNYAFFELFRLSRLLHTLMRDGRPVVLTLHSTVDPIIDGEMVRLGDIAHTLASVDRIIVHQRRDSERLAEIGVQSNVEVVPHGAATGLAASRDEVRARLGFEDRMVVGTFGFALPHKGLIELIRAVALIRRARPDVLLVACCAIHPDPSSSRYFEACRQEVQRVGVTDCVRLIPDFLEPEEARTILSGTDVIVLPYGPTTESASGALRSVIGAGVAVLTTSEPIFDDAADAVDRVETNDPDTLAGRLSELLDDDALRFTIAERCAAYADSVSWTRVAERHLEIYRSLARAVSAG
jgi:glycosyltransferase involved in cell wall biosynthesis